MNLVIDIGNSFTKIAIFNDGTPILNQIVEGTVTVNDLEKIFHVNTISSGIISSVVNDTASVANYLSAKLERLIILNSSTLLPITLKYHTPLTLGNDRIALAVFGAGFFINYNVLLIDSGTCITYDFVTDKSEYLGGGISPGLNMRFKSLNNFTNKLPLLEFNDFSPLIGTSTNESIWSGVQNGIICEMDGIINEYKLKFNDLKVIITGGDHYFLQSRLKNITFADPNALITGLNNILNYNVSIQ